MSTFPSPADQQAARARLRARLDRRVHAILQDFTARDVLDAMIRDLKTSWPQSEAEVIRKLENAGF